ncbi:MAG: hypothetical protein JJU34_16990 [Lunatimonas sp.]|uniref:hypothetical protein n=1 Tax=Lunatimonas sp. TaxID=2060141 RepID=UPI00263AFB1B|nr:hypothetical protein [Lunatimonas sp.]MCC5938977.1 hypothetical protein [Lunatimonas sp.]
MKNLLLLITIVLASSHLLLGQDDRRDRIGVGLGPSKLYGDNTGIHSEFKFKVLPALTLDFSKKIHEMFDAKVTAGIQSIQSGDFYNLNEINKIAEASLPHAFTGSLMFADIMPIYQINPNKSGYLPSLIKGYTGLGLGFFHSSRQDTRRINNDLGGFVEETYDASNSGIYIPFRMGIYMELEKINGEIGLESTLMMAIFGQMEGNDQQQKSIKPDVAAQLQLYYRIPIGK